MVDIHTIYIYIYGGYTRYIHIYIYIYIYGGYTRYIHIYIWWIYTLYTYKYGGHTRYDSLKIFNEKHQTKIKDFKANAL